MSGYRKLDPSLTFSDDARDAVYRFRTVKRTTRPQIESIRGPFGEEAYKHLRKSAPANIPLPHTIKWVEQLPPGVKPVALLRQFPRIANLIAAAWNDLVQFEIYMDSLLTDKRGGRKGFPSDVLNELGALNLYRHTLREGGSQAIAWSDVGPRG